MTRYLSLIFAAFFLIACGKEKTEVAEPELPAEPVARTFVTKNYRKKTERPCKDVCTYVTIDVVEAKNEEQAVNDSINKKIFYVVRSIVYFGEKPTNAKNYEDLTASFIKSYDELSAKYPDEAAISWEAKVRATTVYVSDSLINIKVNSFMFTGGAHGYEGDRSLLFDANTGRSLKHADIFNDLKGFTRYAEKRFRAQYGIPAAKSINSTGLMFENETFKLPDNIFFSKDGIILLYNPVEVGSFADGIKKLTFTYEEAGSFLKIR